jgi:radical SAM superfamily enzyme YgiQ (UPF0313 family)
MKVKFCSHGIVTTTQRGTSFINPAWLFMQKWYELHGKNPDLTWLLPGVLLTNVNESLQDIIDDQPDILGLGVYSWNDDIQHFIAKKVKEQLPNTIIVLGGPNLSVHKDFENGADSTDYFKKHPYVDYVVYGDGEKPFQQIIDYHSGFITSKENFVNIIEKSQGQGKCYTYELLSDELYLSQSPYASQEQHMFEMRDLFISRGFKLSNQTWSIEFARGCMYACTFCDWSQNLTKKVKRRKHDWKLDIDLFYRLDVKVGLTDANFGQWAEDVKAFDYACTLQDPNRNFSFRVSSLPKLKKDVSEYIMIQNALVWGIAPKISIQDPMEDVLTAIDRPSVPWEALSTMIRNIKAKIPSAVFDRTVMETILGLPEQTIDSVVESYMKYYELGLTRSTYALWVILPNSPAADLNYQKLWGIKVKTTYEFNSHGSMFNQDDLDVENLGDLYHRLSQGSPDEKTNFLVPMQIVIGHRKMTFTDLLATKIMITKWDNLTKKFNIREKFSNDQVRAVFVKLKNDAIKEATDQYNLHKEYIDKYNFVVFGKYNPDTKKLSKP